MQVRNEAVGSSAPLDKRVPSQRSYGCAGSHRIWVALLSGRIAETNEVAEGIYYDLDPNGEIVGVEIFAYSRYPDRSDDGLGVLEHLPIASV